jgi:hypothetical protein
MKTIYTLHRSSKQEQNKRREGHRSKGTLVNFYSKGHRYIKDRKGNDRLNEYKALREAVESIPSGSIVIINDLTRLSRDAGTNREMIKRLEDKGCIVKIEPWLNSNTSGVTIRDLKRDSLAVTNSKLWRKGYREDNLMIARVIPSKQLQMDIASGKYLDKTITALMGHYGLSRRSIERVCKVADHKPPRSKRHTAAQGYNHVPMFDKALDLTIGKTLNVANRKDTFYYDKLNKQNGKVRVVVGDKHKEVKVLTLVVGNQTRKGGIDKRLFNSAVDGDMDASKSDYIFIDYKVEGGVYKALRDYMATNNYSKLVTHKVEKFCQSADEEALDSLLKDVSVFTMDKGTSTEILAKIKEGYTFYDKGQSGSNRRLPRHAKVVNTTNSNKTNKEPRHDEIQGVAIATTSTQANRCRRVLKAKGYSNPIIFTSTNEAVEYTTTNKNNTFIVTSYPNATIKALPNVCTTDRRCKENR